jgi:predicted ATPase
MTDEIYDYHSNLIKHDFSNWIRDVIEDEELADELERAASRLEAAECISVRLNEMYL